MVFRATSKLMLLYLEHTLASSTFLNREVKVKFKKSFPILGKEIGSKTNHWSRMGSEM